MTRASPQAGRSDADRLGRAAGRERIAVQAVAHRVARAGRAVGLGQPAHAGELAQRRVAGRAVIGALIADAARLAERDPGAAVAGPVAQVLGRAVRWVRADAARCADQPDGNTRVGPRAARRAEIAAGRRARLA